MAFAAMAARGATLVFGGRGFVGAAICRELEQRGLPVVSLGRSADIGAGGDLGPGVTKHAGVDALKPESYAALLASSPLAVVISVGEAPWTEKTSGSRERAVEANGHTNIAILQAAAAHAVPRIVLVGATMPSWGLIAGYREGKHLAETEAQRYPEASGLADACGVLILKPGVVTGTRYAGRMPIPLGLYFEPMRWVMRAASRPCAALEEAMPRALGGVLRPAVRAQELASAAADAIESKEHRGVQVMGPEELVGYK